MGIKVASTGGISLQKRINLDWSFGVKIWVVRLRWRLRLTRKRLNTNKKNPFGFPCTSDLSYIGNFQHNFFRSQESLKADVFSPQMVVFVSRRCGLADLEEPTISYSGLGLSLFHISFVAKQLGSRTSRIRLSIEVLSIPCYFAMVVFLFSYCWRTAALS